ncbi:MAG: hypothetical protein WC360_04860 [Opitutales bacterium]|jgi:hypothetical protein
MYGKWLTPKTLALLLASALLAWLGVGIPVHFRATSALLLARAGQGTPSVRTMCADYALAGKVGPVRLLWDACPAAPKELERSRILDLLAEKPIYWHSGGPAPYYEAFLGLLPELPPAGKDSHVSDIVLPRANRQLLAQFLSGSANHAVSELMKARTMTGWRRFMPVNSPAGHPLDASILSLALLVQGDYVRPELTRQIPDMIEKALAGQRGEQDRLEDLLLAVLALDRRMDWMQMAELVHCADSPEALVGIAQRVIAAQDDFPTIYAATLLCGDFSKLDAYLKAHPEKGMDAVRGTLEQGKGALEMLFKENKELYEPPALIRFLDRILSPARPGALLNFTLYFPGMALYLKTLLIFCSGFTLALALSCMLKMLGTMTGGSYRRKRPLLALENIFVASAFTIILWMVAEPNLLRFSTESPARPIFEPGAALAAIIPHTNAMNANSLDQAAILTLLLFFFVQLIVYVFCLMRISRLKALDLSAQTKLKLLENEDNLFDLGLYVGLFGTVGSLVMLAMNIVQASLVAAYTSTLFGILVTAVLKIVHIRSFRRALIMEIQGLAESKPKAS